MNIGFEIKKKISVLSYSTKDWSKQLNFVSWNGREPKYDIRDWDDKNEKMGRGVSLTKQEALALYDALRKIFQEKQITNEDFILFDE